MPRLDPTPEFKRLCEAFHQDCMIGKPSIDALADDALSFVSASDRVSLGRFLAAILDGRYTRAELKGLMNRSGTALRWSGENTELLLRAVLARLS